MTKTYTKNDITYSLDHNNLRGSTHIYCDCDGLTAATILVHFDEYSVAYKNAAGFTKYAKFDGLHEAHEFVEQNIDQLMRNLTKR